MADIYTPPPDYSYLLSERFMMPSYSGDRWAVALSNKSAAIMAAALSVLVTVSFLFLWNLIAFAGLLFDGDGSRRRYVALVTLWNSNDPFCAFKGLLSYSWQCWRQNHGHNRTASRNDLWYGFSFCLLAFLAFAGALAMGIWAPSLVQIGNVAPVRPSTVFYPQTPTSGRPVEELQDFGLRAPSVMRSLGSVEAADVTLRSRVNLEYKDGYEARKEGAVASLGYTYHLSGVEMGLRDASGLSLDVEGFCITEYDWLDEERGDSKLEWYNLWKGTKFNQSTYVPINAIDILRAPTAAFLNRADSNDQMLKDANTSYAVLIYAAHRSSITESDDPWYQTESRPTLGPAPFYPKFWMKLHRPMLSCWEKSNWKYNGHSATSVFDLKRLPGMKIKEVLLDVLETALGTSPMIVRLGNASGDSALRSRTTSPNGVINAEKSGLQDDMERLILAAFVATRSIFTDATMFGKPDYDNIFTGPDKQPRPGSGNFVVSSPDIQTFSMTGIVSLVVVLIVLMVANSIAWGCLKFHHNRTQSSNGEAGNGNILEGDKWTRYHVLHATQLFRCLYETDKPIEPSTPGSEVNAEAAGTPEKCGATTTTENPDKPVWSCEKEVPEDEGLVPFELLKCPSKKAHCKGHIQKAMCAKSGSEKTEASTEKKVTMDGTTQNKSTEGDAKNETDPICPEEESLLSNQDGNKSPKGGTEGNEFTKFGK